MPKRIWTIGYEGASVAEVIDALRDQGIEMLADVRALPLSRRPGFSKNALAGAVQEAGIAYRHFKPLGTPADGRAAARRGDIAVLKSIYHGQLESPEALHAAAQLHDIAAQKRTALLCFCGDSAKCHRQLLHETMLSDFERIDLLPAA